MTKHTTTPWRIGNSHSWNIFSGTSLVASVHFGGYQADEKERAEVDANAAYIVHCVNAHDKITVKMQAALAWLEMNIQNRNGGIETDLAVSALRSARLEISEALALAKK